MTWSYDSSKLDVVLNRVRLEIGDTDTNRQLLQNAEITQIVAEQGEFWNQCAACCRLICALFAGKPERFRLEEFTESRQKVYDRYKEMAKVFDAKGGGTPWSGGIEVDYKEAQELDITRTGPLFKRGIHDYR